MKTLVEPWVPLQLVLDQWSARWLIADLCFGLTLALNIPPVDTRTDDHYIVHDSETTLATDPRSVLVPDLTICQHRSFVHRYSLLMKLARIRQLVCWEELPC